VECESYYFGRPWEDHAQRADSRGRRSGLGVWASILAAVAVVAAVGSAIAFYDVRRHVDARLEDELWRRQSHAERSAAHIASELLEDGTPTDLAAVKQARWLRTYWTQTLSRVPVRLIAVTKGRPTRFRRVLDRARSSGVPAACGRPERIGKTVQIRCGPAAVTGDERRIATAILSI
jgi:hypothetical protein